MSTLLVTSWVPEEILSAGKNLKVICNLGVGYDHIDVDLCSEHGVSVINTPEAVCESIAEYAVALMMTLCRGTIHYDQFARKELRTESRCFLDYGMLLYGKTLGILGFGRIGQAVARKAREPIVNEEALDGACAILRGEKPSNLVNPQ